VSSESRSVSVVSAAAASARFSFPKELVKVVSNGR